MTFLHVGTLFCLMLLAWPQPARGEVAALTAAADQWQTLLSRHVRPSGGVDYQGFSKDDAELRQLLRRYGDLPIATLRTASDAERRAAYLNLYNAGMIAKILQYAAAAKIAVSGPGFLNLEIDALKVPGGNIWNGDEKLSLAGQKVSLDDIEHGLLRSLAKDGPLAEIKVQVRDARIHTAANCAAMSCPRLREVAYRPSNLDTLLTENMREFLANEAQFSKVSDATLKANSIVFWYYDDFEEAGQGVGGAGNYLAKFIGPRAKDYPWKVEHLKAHFNHRVRILLKLSSDFEFHYDWLVNDVRRRP